MPKVKSTARSPLAQPAATELPMITAEDAQQFLVTHNMLRETLDYLQRLPAHPMTRELIQKLVTHLENPDLLVTRERAKIAKETDERNRHALLGEFGFLRSGLPVLTAELVGQTLTLSSAGLASETEDPEYILRAENRLLRRLTEGGVQIEMRKRSERIGQQQSLPGET